MPWWNDIVKHAHGVARNSYIIWRNSGRPRHGPVSDDMRRSRLQFKYILKQCQRNEDQARADAMAESMRNHDMKSFWKDVSSTNSRKLPLATTVTVNGASDPAAVCDTSKEPVCPRVELILKIIIILLIIFLGFIKSKPC